MANELTTPNGFLQADDSEYVKLVSHISDVWEKAKCKATIVVNTESLDANWQTVRYVAEFEQHGNVKAEYGKQVVNSLSLRLTERYCSGWNVYKFRHCVRSAYTFSEQDFVSSTQRQLNWTHLKSLMYQRST